MNCLLTNQTPLPATLRPYRDHLGVAHVLVIAKCSWRISTGRMAPGEQQVGLHLQPVSLRLGDLDLDQAQREALGARLDEEIVWLEHDMSPPKPAFDVIVAGYATAPAACETAFIEAGVRIGSHIASMRAHGPRYWERGWLGYRAAPLATAVRRVPLSYALADWPQGFAVVDDADSEGLLPWIESMDATTRRRKHAPMPAGLGYWPESAAHRRAHGGTFDQAWEDDGSPDLPRDFNPRFYNSAHPDLQLPGAPAPGTKIRLAHLAETDLLDFVFPALELSVQARTAAGEEQVAVALVPDTLTIEPDQDRFSIVWRVLLPAAEGADALRVVRLFSPRSALAAQPALRAHAHT